MPFKEQVEKQLTDLGNLFTKERKIIVVKEINVFGKRR